MPARKTVIKKRATIKLSNSKGRVSHQITVTPLISKIQSEFKSGQSYFNLLLGLAIVLLVGMLVYNYFKGKQDTLLPAQQTQVAEQANTPVDVTPQNLPGKYTVKEGDTLFNIAKSYYNDGYRYSTLAQANKLSNPDVIEVGQVLDIPKSGETVTAPAQSEGVGGAINSTIWGDEIEGETYTVAEGDWLSTIAGRAYKGDIMAFDKIAQANNITNPNLIEPGTVLKIPR